MDEMRLAAISDVLKGGGNISREASWWLVCELKDAQLDQEQKHKIIMEAIAERDRLKAAMSANGWTPWEIRQVLERG